MLLLSRQHFTGDEIVGVSNSWNVVMAYYALYHATQAVLTARGFPRPENHAATQRMFLDNLWGALPETFAPWSLSVGAAGPRPASAIEVGFYLRRQVGAYAWDCRDLLYRGFADAFH